MKRWFAPTLGVAASVGFIAFFTLRPSTDDVSGIAQFCLICGERSSADLLLNILLFLPLGLSLAAMRWSWRRAGLVGALLALGIEVAQSRIPGRAPTWRDVAMNGSGSALGAWAWRATPTLIRAARSPATAGFAAVGGVAAAALGVLSTGWLLEPSVKASTWYGLLAPRLSRLEHWSGRVDSAFVGEQRIITGLLTENAAVQREVAARGVIRIAGRAAATPPSDLAPILMLADEVQEEMLLIGQDGADLIVRERRRSSALRFFEPEQRLIGFFASLGPGEPFSLELRPTGRAVCATLGSAEHCSAALAATAGWSIVYWRRGFSPRVQRLMSALTCAALWIPFGLLAAHGARRRIAALAAAASAALLLAATYGGLAMPGGADWAAACVAALLAALAARRVAVVAASRSQ